MTIQQRPSRVRPLVPWIVLAIVVAYLAAESFKSGEVSSPGFNVGEFGRLPVLMSGRVQPLDSVARIGLLQISGRIVVPAAGRDARAGAAADVGPTEWLLELMTKPDVADTRKIFPVSDPALALALHLQSSTGSGPAYYAFGELRPHLTEIGKQTARVSRIKPAQRAEWEREGLRLRNALVVYERLKNSLQPNSFLQQEAQGQPIDYDFAGKLAKYQADLTLGVKAAIAREHGKVQPLDTETEGAMRVFARPFIGVSRAGLLAVVPPADPTRARDRWESIGALIVESARTGQLAMPVSHYAAMSSAFARGKPLEFNRELARYQQYLKTRGLQPEMTSARYESFYNAFQPFVRAAAVYALAIALLGMSFLKRSTALYRSAATMVAVGWLLQTLGLLFDMMLEGRPPVTNRYILIIFAGWLAALLAVVAERFFRNGLGLATASVSALIALLVAHGLAPGGTAALAFAALDLRFWITVLMLAVVLAAGRTTTLRALQGGVTDRFGSRVSLGAR